MRMNIPYRGLAFLTMASVVLAPSVARAQQAADAAGQKGENGEASFSQEELDQMLAPLALYPDALLAQILMASTYPLEVVQAERWAKKNGNLKGNSLTSALEKEDWDPSVKSLVNFPQLLTMMSEQLDWTQTLGDAFLEQQKQVMDTVQKLRSKAKAAGNLETTKEQKIVVKEEAQTQVIVIESSSPEVIYVPAYNPTVVYGAWWYPSYPPYYYHPPGYVAGVAAISFGVGVACGASWGYAWGGCRWGHGDIDIDVNRNVFANNNINRSRYNQNIQNTNINNRNTNIDRRSVQGASNSWQHDPSHRKGSSYRDKATAQRFGSSTSADAARGRDAFRGRAEAGRQEISRGGADTFKGSLPSSGAVSAGRGAEGDRGGNSAGNRGATGARESSANRGTTANRSAGTNRGSAFDGVDRGGGSARNQSQRGQASRGGASRSGGGRSGGGRR